MATNITSASAFTTSNMKPAPNEQADALWAQNLADNTGYLYYKTSQVHIPTISGSSPNWLAMFTKIAGRNTLKIKTRGDNTGAAAAVTDTFRVYADGIDTVAGAATLTATNSFTRGVNATNVYSMDISTLTDGAHYVLKLTLDGAKTFLSPSIYLE